MVPVLKYAGETVLVMGMGKSGLSAARALKASAADVLVWDDDSDRRQIAEKEGFKAQDPLRIDLTNVSCVVWSPGIPSKHPKSHAVADAARNSGVPLVCDVDLLLQARSDATFLCITGTNGKSTTTALTAHILRRSGRHAEAGGNIGTPALDLKCLNFGGTYVLELSSYQLELMPSLSCEAAVLLNISPDHLDRHGGLNGYIKAKKRIFENQITPHLAIVGLDDEHSKFVFANLKHDGIHQTIGVSSRNLVPGGVYLDGAVVIDDTEGTKRPVVDLSEIHTLPGLHNRQNAAAACALAIGQGIPHSTIASGIRSFAGLEHRQEFVTQIDGVSFVNDSKATNVDAVEKAFLCYDTIYWIAGGIAKEGGIERLLPLLGRVRHAFLIGEAATEMADVLSTCPIAYTLCNNIETAVAKAGQMALSECMAGATVLLSPACASFDMFANFEARGDAFRSAVLGEWPPPHEATA